MKMYIFGWAPSEKAGEPSAHLYDAALRKDLKTLRGAYNWAQRCAAQGTTRKGFKPVLHVYSHFTLEGNVLPKHVMPLHIKD